MFCDASEYAYGCAAYVRFTFKNQEHACALVMAKSRLAPIKTITLPRLELNSARIGARLANLVVHEMELPVERIHYWVDSTLTLQCLYNVEHRMKIFVANRVTEILETSVLEDWSWLPSNQNPADLQTRGVSDPAKLMKIRWFIAPEFLEKDEEDWPKLEVGKLSEDYVEIKKKPFFVGTAIVEIEGVNFERISNWRRLLRVAAWVIRSAANWLCHIRGKEEKNIDETLSLEELEMAKDVVFKDIQWSAFSDELHTLSKGRTLSTDNRLSALSPFVDSNGLLRVGGRLKKVQISPATKYPIILPRTHKATKALVEWVHRRNGHVGPDHVLSILREEYWVLSGRVVINQVVNRCFFCRVRKAKQQFPFMADLPLCRAAIGDPPFSHSGVDLFGPIYIKQGRKRLKRWAVLFTCLTIRCVHLEVVESCDTGAFINSVRRFVNRRGAPINMYSDHGKNFEGATTELEEFVFKLDKTKITDFATTHQIQWTFNPPAAPHMGGAWERLVRSAKEVMYGLIKNYVLTDDQLLTLLTEVEHILNSRPLTHLSEDVTDLDPLTPNHILLGLHRNWVSIADISEIDIDSRKQWKQVQGLRAEFWKRWVKEYLPTLTKRPCWRSQRPTYVVGELVLLQDDDFKRGKWPMARITKLIPGKDGVVRVVELRTSKGTYTRPVTKVYKLEDN